MRSKEPKQDKINNSKPNISYLFEQEFTTLLELDNLSLDHKRMVLQSILIIERIYGANHLITLKFLSERFVCIIRNEITKKTIN